jgi:hypothetical protein
MPITNHTPFEVAPLYWQDLEGQAKLTIIIKATFVISSPGIPAREQIAIFRRDVFHDGDAQKSVRFESDMVPRKPRADVVLVGRAHAPERRATTQLVAGLRVGTLRHAIAVLGDRSWEYQKVGSPTISKPKPFTTMDLVYERAFGGMDVEASVYCAENLTGTGFIGKKTRDRVSGLRLPNLEELGNLIQAWDSRPSPAGFGFYGRAWMPRLGKAGTDAFFNAAHPSLQMQGYLKGDEEVELVNLHREPHVRFRLPGARPAIEITRGPSAQERNADSDLAIRGEKLRPVLDTLVFIPDDGVFYEVFRAVCDLPSLDDVDVTGVSVTL